MGAAAVLSGVRAAVNSCAPVTWTDRGWRCHDGPRETSPYEWIRSPERQLRDAALGWATLPRVGTAPCYVLADLALEVAYPLSEPDDLRVRIIGEDCGRLAQWLVSDPSRWGGADRLYQTEAPTVETVTDDDGRPSHLVVTMTFSLMYRET